MIYHACSRLHKRAKEKKQEVLAEVTRSIIYMLWFLEGAPVGTKRFFDPLGVLYLYDYLRYTRRGEVSPRPPSKGFVQSFFRFCVPASFLSSVLIYSMLHACLIYSDKPGNVLSLSYAQSFHWFRTFEFTPPELMLDLSKIGMLIEYLKDLRNAANMLEASRALNALNLLLSLIKPLLTHLMILLYSLKVVLYSREAADNTKLAKNIQFKELADATFKAEEKIRYADAHLAARKRVVRLERMLEVAKQSAQARRDSLVEFAECQGVSPFELPRGESRGVCISSTKDVAPSSAHTSEASASRKLSFAGILASHTCLQLSFLYPLPQAPLPSRCTFPLLRVSSSRG
jgi:hypothetical protein